MILVLLLLAPLMLQAKEIPGTIHVDGAPMAITVDNVYPFPLHQVHAEILSAPRWLAFDRYSYQLGTLARYDMRTISFDYALVEAARGQEGMVEVAFFDEDENAFDYQFIPVKAPVQVATDATLHVFPNPANPEATIQYQLQSPADVRVDIYNMVGQHILTLYDGIQQAGAYRLQWNGRDRQHNAMPSGIYFVKLVAFESEQTIQQLTRKILLQK